MTDSFPHTPSNERASWREVAQQIGLCLRHPAEVMRRQRNGEIAHFTALVLAFLGSAVAGVALYGATMQLHGGAGQMLRAGVVTPIAAGLAWVIALPALYIFNSAFGSRLSVKETLLAASITVCFGSWAMLASVPITWFFTLALPHATVQLLVNVVVFAGVGVCMIDVFIRTLRALEPKRFALYGFVWVGLVGVIGLELFSLFDVFSF